MCGTVTTAIEHQHARSAALLALFQYFLNLNLTLVQVLLCRVFVSEDMVEFDHLLELIELFQVFLRRDVCELIAAWDFSQLAVVSGRRHPQDGHHRVSHLLNLCFGFGSSLHFIYE